MRAIALLWNPLIPVYLNRAAWLPLDLLAAAFLVACAIALRPAAGWRGTTASARVGPASGAAAGPAGTEALRPGGEPFG